ncbi:succinylglutamate desuccinylase/aspartoacylase family protein [Elongatibacter sediminis]|uniref:Succinylglutamate desuccinylase/aspartoacylase family protein n=1 Tax=Elongatibacter sediminis TaxID=3119006 RepID=A0AAW9RAS0_9GAMM
MSIRNRIITADHGGDAIRVPLIEISGASDGPVTSIVAGVHGAEYCGIEAAVRLSREIDSERLRGTLRIVTVANVPGFLGRCEVQCPVDGQNLNRLFPGSATKDYTDHLASVIYENCVRDADCVLNIHGGDIFEELVPYTGIGRTGNAQVDERCRELGRAYGLPFLLESGSPPGAVAGGSSLNQAAQADGITSILAESGGRGLLEEEFVETHLRGMRNTLKWMDMLDGDLELPNEVRELTTDFWRISSEGICYPEQAIGDRVREGQRIGEVKDWFGDTVEELIAPRDAWIVAVVITPAARKDAIVYQVAF